VKCFLATSQRGNYNFFEGVFLPNMASSEFFFLIIIWQLGPGISSGHYGSGRGVLARSVDTIVDTRHMLILCYIYQTNNSGINILVLGLRKFKEVGGN
jgi:hypothetical protein